MAIATLKESTKATHDRLKVEIVDLKEAAGYVMDTVLPQANPEEPTELLDCLVAVPDRMTDLLRSTGKIAAVGALTWVKSYFPEIDAGKLAVGPNEEADLEALEQEEEVQAAATKVVECLDL
ncbi:unnamed protein product [Urochloa humidicola]